MILAPMNPNAIEIPTAQTGCCKTEFDSTYPIHLNGIITQAEFQESIENINRAISSQTSLLVLGVVFVLCIFGGMALFIAGGATAMSSRTYGFPVLVGIGFGVFFLGMIIGVIGFIIRQSRRISQMRQAIANESMKYSSRSPTPCSWRLNSTSFYTSAYGNRRTVVTYHIIIEIGHSLAPGSGYVPYPGADQPTSFFSPQSSAPSPPPYDSRPATSCCPHCGMPLQNPTAKFCASCGQPLNMF